MQLKYSNYDIRMQMKPQKKSQKRPGTSFFSYFVRIRVVTHRSLDDIQLNFYSNGYSSKTFSLYISVFIDIIQCSAIMSQKYDIIQFNVYIACNILKETCDIFINKSNSNNIYCSPINRFYMTYVILLNFAKITVQI